MKQAILPRAGVYSAMLGLAAGLAGPVSAQSIVFTEGGADLTFFYNSGLGSWDTIFRTKGNTVATNLTSPYGTPPGGVGGSANDFNFTDLTVRVTTAPFVEVNGVPYLVTPASGTGYNIETQPDFGFRTRLREDDNGTDVNQFANLRVTLNTGASEMPAGAEFILFRAGDPLAGEPPNVILYETAAGDLVHDWPAWGHTHWHWGFSQPGNYSFVFDFQGIGGLYGPSSIDSVTVNFSVIPEPRAFAAAFGLVALGFVLLLRRRAQIRA
ncbi:MAG: hypothetical protein JJT96_02210 [Opitutales bacterium]|nr:hypothetical protein [Opitutales bacterium]